MKCFCMCVGNSLHCDLMSVKMGIRKLNSFVLQYICSMFWGKHELDPPLSCLSHELAWSYSRSCGFHAAASTPSFSVWNSEGGIGSLGCSVILIVSLWYSVPAFSVSLVVTASAAREPQVRPLDSWVAMGYSLSTFEVTFEFVKICLGISLCLYIQQ